MSAEEVSLPPAQFQFFGGAANVHWRSVSWADLRAHPLFQALPPPQSVCVQSAQDLSQLRQDSWQWEALHQGRLTTSRLASLLGLYESLSAALLGVPLSLCGHERAVAAWNEVRRRPPQNWQHLNADNNSNNSNNSNSNSNSNSNNDNDNSNRESESEIVWIARETSALSHSQSLSPFGSAVPSTECAATASVAVSSSSVSFSHTYAPPAPATDPQSHKQSSRVISDAVSARLAWGHAQEATALLAVLNALPSLPAPLPLCTHSRLRESGMLTVEALREALCVDNGEESVSLTERERLYREVIHAVFVEETLPLLGASPDGLIDYFQPSVSAAPLLTEVVEVKCVSPFAARRGSGNNSVLRVSRDRSRHEGVPVWHIPQVQLEIFCAGPSCESALLVVLFVDGARMFRIQRDDGYIRSMLGFVKEFYVRFVKSVPSNRMKAPPENFFSPSQNRAYAAFLQHTKRIAQSAELVRELNDEEIQRSPYNDLFFLA